MFTHLDLMMNLTIGFFKIYIINAAMTSSAILHVAHETFICSDDSLFVFIYWTC